MIDHIYDFVQDKPVDGILYIVVWDTSKRQIQRVFPSKELAIQHIERTKLWTPVFFREYKYAIISVFVTSHTTYPKGTLPS